MIPRFVFLSTKRTIPSPPSVLKRGYHGTFRHVSEKHLERCVREFPGRRDIRDLDAIMQMSTLADDIGIPCEPPNPDVRRQDRLPYDHQIRRPFLPSNVSDMYGQQAD